MYVKTAIVKVFYTLLPAFFFAAARESDEPAPVEAFTASTQIRQGLAVQTEWTLEKVLLETGFKPHDIPFLTKKLEAALKLELDPLQESSITENPKVNSDTERLSSEKKNGFLVVKAYGKEIEFPYKAGEKTLTIQDGNVYVLRKKSPRLFEIFQTFEFTGEKYKIEDMINILFIKQIRVNQDIDLAIFVNNSSSFLGSEFSTEYSDRKCPDRYKCLLYGIDNPRSICLNCEIAKQTKCMWNHYLHDAYVEANILLEAKKHYRIYRQKTIGQDVIKAKSPAEVTNKNKVNQKGGNGAQKRNKSL